MDFGKMKDQVSEKVKEELVQKVDEIKADIEEIRRAHRAEHGSHPRII